MATDFHRLTTFPANPVTRLAPSPAVMRLLEQIDRPRLEGFISVAIGLLDVLDGDSDDEANGDEGDGTPGAEDEFGPTGRGGGLDGPGCPLSDPDCSVDDQPCDAPLEGY